MALGTLPSHHCNTCSTTMRAGQFSLSGPPPVSSARLLSCLHTHPLCQPCRGTTCSSPCLPCSLGAFLLCMCCSSFLSLNSPITTFKKFSAASRLSCLYYLHSTEVPWHQFRFSVMAWAQVSLHHSPKSNLSFISVSPSPARNTASAQCGIVKSILFFTATLALSLPLPSVLSNKRIPLHLNPCQHCPDSSHLGMNVTTR